METAVKKTRIKRGVDRSPFIPGEQELVESVRAKVYAARAKKKAAEKK